MPTYIAFTSPDCTEFKFYKQFEADDLPAYLEEVARKELYSLVTFDHRIMRLTHRTLTLLDVARLRNKRNLVAKVWNPYTDQIMRAKWPNGCQVPKRCEVCGRKNTLRFLRTFPGGMPYNLGKCRNCKNVVHVALTLAQHKRLAKINALRQKIANAKLAQQNAPKQKRSKAASSAPTKRTRKQAA